MQKSSSSFYSNFVLNLYIVKILISYEMFFGTVDLVKKVKFKSEFIYNSWGIVFDGEGS